MFDFYQDRLKINEKLGKGRFGTVFPYQKHPEDLRWVVKRVKAEDADAFVASLPEVILGMSCDHPNIVPIKGYFVEKNSNDEGYNIYTKLPRMKRTLLDDIKERKTIQSPYSEEEVIRHFYSLVCGIEYLHSTKKIFHGDIKPESLLLDYDGTLKIGDIGISKHIIEDKRCAPEILGVDINKEVLRKADIWSLGIVILELCCFDLKLFNASWSKDQLLERLNGLFESLQGRYSSSVVDLLQKILSLNQKERPEIEVIKGELEKSFPEILDDKVKEKTEVISISDEQKQEIFGKYEAEIKHLKRVISQFESLAQKADVKTPAKSYTKGDEETKTNSFEEEIRKLQEEKTKISKEHHELLLKERLENTKLKETIKSLETTVSVLQEAFKDKPKIERPKRESPGVTYEDNLKDVVSQLNSKWNKWYKSASFECKADGKFLQIMASEKSITDESLSKFSKDILKALEDNYLLNLHGITFFCSIPPLTDRSMSDFAYMLSNESLKLQHVVIYIAKCQGLTDKSFEDLAKALAIQSPHLTHLRLMFNECPGLTDKSLDYLAKNLSIPSRLHYLELSFEKAKEMTNSGFDNVARAIENGNQKNKSLRFLHLTFPDTQITPEKKEQIKKKFEKIIFHTLEIK